MITTPKVQPNPAIQNSIENNFQGASSNFSRHKVSISDLSKPLVLKYLWDNAQGEGPAYKDNPGVSATMRFLPEMDIEAAQQYIQEALSNNKRLYFETLNGKPLKIDITDNVLCTLSYNNCHGDGTASRAIEMVRQHSLRKNYLEEFERFDQAKIEHPELNEITDGTLSKLLQIALYPKK